MGKMSRDKGKLGEREVAQLLRDYGFTARRGQQFKGTKDSPDIVHSMPGLYVEVKRRENLQIFPVLEQADAKITKRSRWYFTAATRSPGSS